MAWARSNMTLLGLLLLETLGLPVVVGRFTIDLQWESWAKMPLAGMFHVWVRYHNSTGELQFWLAFKVISVYVTNGNGLETLKQTFLIEWVRTAVSRMFSWLGQEEMNRIFFPLSYLLGTTLQLIYRWMGLATVMLVEIIWPTFLVPHKSAS